jgi:exopolysaccharide biosynthesis polyprenyl glycosylphosphotransferase
MIKREMSTMQPDFEYGISMGPSQNAYKAKREMTREPQQRELPEVQKRLRFSQTTWRHILILGDEILFLALLAVVLTLTPHLNLELRVSSHELNPWYLKILWGILAVISWSVAVRMTQAQELANAVNLLNSALRILFALLLALVCWVVLTYPIIISGVVYVRAVLFFLLVAAPALSIWRAAFAEVINLPRFRRRAVIVGVNSAGEAIAEELRKAKPASISVLGYISESVDEGLHSDGLTVFSGRDGLRRLRQRGMVDMIIMAIDYHANPELFQEAIEAIQVGISVVPMTVMYEHTSGKIPVEHVRDQWYMALLSGNSLSPLYLYWRKGMDIAFGLVGMLVLIVVLPIVALLMYLESPGPIFYHQERMGRQGKKFTIHKFRSMHPNAEAAGRAVWTTKDDARITRLGHFLRATHLDELPQVLNILRGEMSLIGPRPERPAFIAKLEKTIPFYTCRLVVKPGLTGWAQVHSGYASSDQETLMKLQYDLYYIKHQSFTLDVLILLKTIVEVLFFRGT